MSSYARISLALWVCLTASCGDDGAADTETDATVDGQATNSDASAADASSAKDATTPLEASTQEAGPVDDGSVVTSDAGHCTASAPVAPEEQSCSAGDVTCFFAADSEEERQKCAEQSETGASCLDCVLLGGAACAYENGCVSEWNDLYCCQQRECANQPFELCPACAPELAARQACETSVAAKCLTAGTSCFPSL